MLCANKSVIKTLAVTLFNSLLIELTERKILGKTSIELKLSPCDRLLFNILDRLRLEFTDSLQLFISALIYMVSSNETN